MFGNALPLLLNFLVMLRRIALARRLLLPNVPHGNSPSLTQAQSPSQYTRRLWGGMPRTSPHSRATSPCMWNHQGRVRAIKPIAMLSRFD